METSSFLAEFEQLPKQIQKQVLDYIEFLVTKHKKNKIKPDHKDYYKRIQTVSQWSEEDVKYLQEIKKQFNWKVEEW